ncbi:MAG TPA: hypothetical protein VLB51_13920 [Methylomirabilota bacterium]|nr:hypothetical protein [Methylomirabilota bacterium]
MNALETPRDEVTCSEAWQALRGDSLDWLLDPARPNLYWRVLVDVIGRPLDSPAVRRARGGANVAEPVASLLADLHPDGHWATDLPLWAPDGGPGWRLVAAVQMGADPEDPRLHAASERLLEEAPGDGGLLGPGGSEPDPRLTARTLEALTGLGWKRHPRVQEWLAWLDETGGWEGDPVAATAVLGACGTDGRPTLRERAADGLDAVLAADGDRGLDVLGHPNLLRTDLAEVFAVLAAARVEPRRSWRRPLESLQRLQDGDGRWPLQTSMPKTLGPPEPPGPSKWVTLKATRAMLAYAVAAELPRLFPYPPDRE